MTVQEAAAAAFCGLAFESLEPFDPCRPPMHRPRHRRSRRPRSDFVDSEAFVDSLEPSDSFASVLAVAVRGGAWTCFGCRSGRTRFP